jgi:hypothetical protein
MDHSDNESSENESLSNEQGTPDSEVVQVFRDMDAVLSDTIATIISST